jgi:hypothetical protein
MRHVKSTSKHPKAQRAEASVTRRLQAKKTPKSATVVESFGGLTPGQVVKQVAERKFDAFVPVPLQTLDQMRSCGQAVVVRDANGRTAIELSRDGGAVVFIPQVVDRSFDVATMNPTSFDCCYTQIRDYPVARAAVLYGGFMQMIGATQAAIDAVTGLVTLPAEQIEAARAKTLARSAAIQARFSKKSTDEESSEESEMPEAKSSKSSGSKVKVTEAVMKPVAAKPVAAKPVAAKPVAAKPVAAKPVAAKPVAAKPVAAKPVAAKPVAAKPVAAKPVAAKPVAAKELPFCPIDKNASSMIRRLIMEHQLTNEQIIEAMKKVFAGSNLKVSDVSWYRNDLRKKGMNPPDAVK